MTRSRDVADSQDNLGGAVAPWVGAKNFLINGSMDISQRGTTFTGVNSVYTLDRWYYASFGTSTTANVSQGSTDSVPGIQYYARVAANSATLSNYNFTQTIETANTIPLRGKTVTVSFWMRTPVAFSNIFVWNLRYSTSADTRISNAGTGTAVGSDFTFTGPTTWTKYSQTVTIPSDASSLGFVMGTYNNTVATAYFDITGVQLELGSQATPFARSGGSIGGELALCQRYYWRAKVASGFGTLSNYWFPNTTSLAYAEVSIPVPLRALPSAVEWGGNIGVSDGFNLISGISSITVAGTTPFTTYVALTTNMSSASLTVYRGYKFADQGAGTAFLAISAEL
jgi:hypothetical protein